MYLVFHLGYIFLVVGTYSFILKVYLKQKNFRKTTQGTKKEYSFNFLLPALIIVTFILHNVTPNITNKTCRYKFKSFSKTVIKLAFISYRIGQFLDPLIYNFFQIGNRKHPVIFRHIFCDFSNILKKIKKKKKNAKQINMLLSK